MSAGDIYGKTALGVQEVSSRKMKLAPRLRTMLILIDGHQPAFVLREEANKLGAPGDFVDQLLALRLIERLGSAVSPEAASADRAESAALAPKMTAPAGDEFARFRAAKDFMNVTVVDALGIKSFFFTLKLERAGNVADLRELADGYQEAIRKGSGEEEARVLAERLKVMLR